jgi:hypothetical protein
MGLPKRNRSWRVQVWRYGSFGDVAKGRILVLKNYNVKIVWYFTQVDVRRWTERTFMAWWHKGPGVTMGSNCYPLSS